VKISCIHYTVYKWTNMIITVSVNAILGERFLTNNTGKPKMIRLMTAR